MSRGKAFQISEKLFCIGRNLMLLFEIKLVNKYVMILQCQKVLEIKKINFLNYVLTS